MTCSKVKYDSEQDARSALTLIRNSSKRQKIPCRAYFCYDCENWHLTSQGGPKEKKKQIPEKQKPKDYEKIIAGLKGKIAEHGKIIFQQNLKISEQKKIIHQLQIKQTEYNAKQKPRSKAHRLDERGP